MVERNDYLSCLPHRLWHGICSNVGIMSKYNATSSTENVRLVFPSLEDSPLWSDDFAVAPEASNEETPPLFIIRGHYPKIAKAIELMWGTMEMDAYFNRLIVNDRVTRAGFPREVMAAILKLSADHTKRFKFDQNRMTAEAWGMDSFQRHAFRNLK